MYCSNEKRIKVIEYCIVDCYVLRLLELELEKMKTLLGVTDDVFSISSFAVSVFKTF